jgi:large subunit ribosomal protein L25
VVRWVKVRCLPKYLPSEFLVDIKDLNIMQSKKIADLPVPANVKVLNDPKQVTVIIGKIAQQG